MSSERASVHASGRFDREKALGCIERAMPVGASPQELLDALEVCVVPDPRLACIEALSQDWKFHRGTDAIAFADELTAALRGEQ